MTHCLLFLPLPFHYTALSDSAGVGVWGGTESQLQMRGSCFLVGTGHFFFFQKKWRDDGILKILMVSALFSSRSTDPRAR